MFVGQLSLKNIILGVILLILLIALFIMLLPIIAIGVIAIWIYQKFAKKQYKPASVVMQDYLTKVKMQVEKKVGKSSKENEVEDVEFKVKK